jgi:hypothetical protein
MGSGVSTALLVESSASGAAVGRHIHLNPVHAAEGTGQTVAERRAPLRDYRWCSYRATIGLARIRWLAQNRRLETANVQQRNDNGCRNSLPR